MLTVGGKGSFGLQTGQPCFHHFYQLPVVNIADRAENHVFRRLYHRGATAGNRLLVVYCLRNGTGHSRLGLTVSAKLGHAVERNRMRRRLREVYRLHEAELLPGYDIVIVARSRAMEADFAELTRAFLTLAGRTGLMQEAAQ